MFEFGPQYPVLLNRSDWTEPLSTAARNAARLRFMPAIPEAALAEYRPEFDERLLERILG